MQYGADSVGVEAVVEAVITVTLTLIGIGKTLWKSCVNAMLKEKSAESNTNR